VVEVDGTAKSLPAVGYAAEEAARAGTELVLVAPYHTDPAYGGSMIGHDSHAAEVAAEALSEGATYARKRFGGELKVSTASVEGSRLKVLQRASREARFLVVAREPAKSGRFESAQGNLAVAGRIACPLITVPGAWRPDPTGTGVVVGIDGTPLSLEAVEFAFRVAADRGAALTVIHSQQLPYRRSGADAGSWQEQAALTVAETLAGWQEEYPQVHLARLLTTQPVVTALAGESRQAGLIVVGAHAGPLPVGDPVARRIIAEMTCPVAIAAHHVTPAESSRRLREVQVRPAEE
jgi:nucleotide-binding universal stress UspA family protein